MESPLLVAAAASLVPDHGFSVGSVWPHITPKAPCLLREYLCSSKLLIKVQAHNIFLHWQTRWL